MQTIQFFIPSLDQQAEVGDLGTALTGLSGVERIDVDISNHTVTVDYDPDFVSPVLVAQTIERTGYPEGGQGTQLGTPEAEQ